MYRVLFVLLFMLAPPSSFADYSVSDLMRDYSKIDIVNAVLKKSGGMITITRGIFMEDYYGKPSLDLVTAETIAKDLKGLKLSAVDAKKIIDFEKGNSEVVYGGMRNQEPKSQAGSQPESDSGVKRGGDSDLAFVNEFCANVEVSSDLARDCKIDLKVGNGFSSSCSRALKTKTAVIRGLNMLQSRSGLSKSEDFVSMMQKLGASESKILSCGRYIEKLIEDLNYISTRMKS